MIAEKSHLSEESFMLPTKLLLFSVCDPLKSKKTRRANHALLSGEKEKERKINQDLSINIDSIGIITTLATAHDIQSILILVKYLLHLKPYSGIWFQVNLRVEGTCSGPGPKGKLLNLLCLIFAYVNE